MDFLEIRLSVGRFLSNVDLAACVQVSKLWNESFTPFLYYEVTVDNYTYTPNWPSLERYLDHVRHLVVHRIDSFCHRELLLRCRLLKRHDFQTPLVHGRDENHCFAVALLERNPELRTVEFKVPTYVPSSPRDGNNDDPPCLIETLIRCCPLVTDLGLLYISLNDQLLWRRTVDGLGCRLTRLQVYWTRPVAQTNGWGTATDANEQAALGQPVFPVLQHLIVTSPYCQDLSWEDQLLVFERSPKLESISWLFDLEPRAAGATEASDNFLETFSLLLENRTWPRLDSIRLSSHCPRPARTVKVDDALVARLLNSCPNGLRELALWHSGNGTESRSKTWKALRRHFDTLQYLKLSSTIFSWWIQEILSSCPRLQEFHGGTLFAYDLVKGYGAEGQRESVVSIERRIAASQRRKIQEQSVDDEEEHEEVLKELIEDEEACFASRLAPRPWVCKRLQVLKISLLKMCEEGANNQVFDQLTQMKELRVIYLCQSNKRPHYGLDPRVPLRIPTDANAFRGEYTQRLWMHPVGKRLLEIWPALTSCRFHMA